jgi:hypothetical protein
MGFYSATRETMDNLRRSIEVKPAEFRKIVAFLGRQETFTLEGDRYKRPLNPTLPDDLQEWHGRKNIYFMCQRPAQEHCVRVLLYSGLRQFQASGCHIRRRWSASFHELSAMHWQAGDTRSTVRICFARP